MNQKQLFRISNKLIILLSFLIGFQKVSIGPLKIFDLCVLLVFVWLLAERKIKIYIFPYLIMGLIYIVYLFQTVVSINSIWSLMEDIRLIFCFISFSIFVSLFEISKEKALKNVVLGIFLYCVLSLMLFIIEIANIYNFNVTHGWSMRLESLMLDPNYFAFICIFGLILLNTTKQQLSKKFYIIAIVLFILCVTFSGSRTALALLIFFFFTSYFMINGITIKSFFLILSAFILIFIIAFNLGFLDTMIERLEYTQTSGGVQEDLRFHIWRLGLKAFDEWQFGYGPGTYRYATQKFGGHHDAHSTYFWLLINNGILFVLFLGVYLSYLMIFVKIPKFGKLCIIFLFLTSILYSMETFRVSWLFISISYFLYLEKNRINEIREVYN